MPCQNHLPVPARRAYRRRREPRLASLAASKHEFLATHRHAMQFSRVVQPQKPVIHMPARGEFAEHGRKMPARALDPASPR